MCLQICVSVCLAQTQQAGVAEGLEARNRGLTGQPWHPLEHPFTVVTFLTEQEGW